MMLGDAAQTAITDLGQLAALGASIYSTVEGNGQVSYNAYDPNGKLI